MTPETDEQRLRRGKRIRELVIELRALDVWRIAGRIQELEHKLDVWVPSWRTPQDDGHDLEDAMIHLQRRELTELRKRVMELEEEHQHQCPECRWHGFHKRGCTRSLVPHVDDDPTSPF